MAREWKTHDIEPTDKSKLDAMRAAQLSIRVEKANGIVQVAKSLQFAVRGQCNGDAVKMIVETLQRQLDSLIQHYAKTGGNVTQLPYPVQDDSHDDREGSE